MAYLKYIIILSSLAVVALSKPASNEELDKATVDDVAVNAVTKRQDEFITNDTPKKDTSVEISGITTGIDGPENPEKPSVFNPPRAGSMFARFIDDIFQIPITVLQSVAKLITNPFTTKSTPEQSADKPSY